MLMTFTCLVAKSLVDKVAWYAKPVRKKAPLQFCVPGSHSVAGVARYGCFGVSFAALD
ncbi:hypothetical protein AGMMS49960_02760 [Betaproteobacteria bacterium]|nr:hypothetical protein AGMMS49960_02760 [Betaproteobacteria bacterium]